MEFLSSQMPSRSHFFPNAPLSSPKLPYNETPLSIRIPTSQFFLRRQILTFLPLSKRRVFHVSAQFGRHSARLNSLRRKLAENPEVRKIPPLPPPPLEMQNPNQGFHVTDDPGSNLEDPVVKENDVVYKDGDPVGDAGSARELKSELVGTSGVLFEKLDNWVTQYKNDVEFWGLGSGPVFTVFQGLEGKVERVSVHEDEISRRTGQHFADPAEVNSKVKYAKHLAKEIESGVLVLPSNSSIAKFVVPGANTSLFEGIRSVTLKPDLLLKLSRVGVLLFCGSLVFWVVKRLLTVGDDRVEMTQLKREMLRRKKKARMGREMLEKGTVELIQDSVEPRVVPTKRPQLDRQELMTSISKAKMTVEKLETRESFEYQSSESMERERKIQEIALMARQAREIEAAGSSEVTTDDEENQAENEEIHNETREKGGDLNWESTGKGEAERVKMPEVLQYSDSNGNRLYSEAVSVNNGYMQSSFNESIEVTDVQDGGFEDLKDSETSLSTTNTEKPKQFSGIVDAQFSLSENSSIRKKPRIIRSVKEAKEFLSEKREKRGNENHKPQNSPYLRMPREGLDNIGKQQLDSVIKEFKSLTLGSRSDIMNANAYEHSTGKEKQFIATEIGELDTVEEKSGLSVQAPNPEGIDSDMKVMPSANKETWLEKNFEEFKPVIEKIRVGFRDNYAVAREKVNQDLNVNSDIGQLVGEGDNKLEWMKNDDLRKIVYQVRENELAGHEPFSNMDAEDKLAFFKGLEKMVEKQNENLLKAHEWMHSNIENVDYGADGISLYDPPEKIIPRWKGPPIDKDPEFLNYFLEQRKAFAAGNTEVTYPLKNDEQDSLQRPEESKSTEKTDTSVFYNQRMKFHDGASKNSRTIIESSDGSVKAGKRSGKEYWQHTKKWSHGFLEVYNAESDPEVKSDLKDVGKDLDRWITEKEIKEAADLMNGLPARKKEFIEKRVNKLKREMEQFGPQAVVSKYKEYAEEKEEDYLWWLDLPYVLCIELYTHENGDQRIGFYSLEMAADLKLNPKQYHVIAFEDPGDCKNLCYIIEAHMEMLGNGHAFVIARPPKDAFREAKANGFSVTIIRKGELPLNVDQPLEEVEEQITEIGSKVYHDKFTRERSVDLSSVMKGVLGANQTNTKKRLKRLQKKRAKLRKC